MTRFNNKYPYTDFHELNADWLLETVKDAAAEAQEASDTVATYNDRLTTVEGDLAPIKAAMPGLASDVSDLQHDVGIMDSLITNTINPGLDTLQNEVETPSTGLLDRMTAAEGSISTLQNEVETPTTGLLDRVTALENQPSTGGITEYLRFRTGGTPIDWDPRITYTYLDGLIATTASADKTVNIILVEDDELGNTWYYTLNAGRYQISAGTPRGGFAFTCRKPVLDGNNVIVGYNVCMVDVDKNAATPTYTEVYEAALPTVTSADAGDVLTVDNSGNWVAGAGGSGVHHTLTQYNSNLTIDRAEYIEFDDYYVVTVRVTATDNIGAGSILFTSGISTAYATDCTGVNGGASDYTPICFVIGVTGNVILRNGANNGDLLSFSTVVIK